MNRVEAKQLLAEVRANHKRLTECTAHAFEGEEKTAWYSSSKIAMFKYYVCKNCGGRVDSHAHHWFEVGLKQGKAET